MDIVSKINGNTLSATEFNQIPTELEAVQTSSGQTSSDAILDQVSIGVARYSACNFYTDSGAADAYVLSPKGSFKSPVSGTVPYYEGMYIRFRAGNANTGASTVNVNSAGIKDLKQADGITALSLGDVPTTQDSVFRYDGTSFVLAVGSASTTAKGIAEIATQPETNTGTDDTRIVTPLKLTTWYNSKVKSYDSGEQSITSSGTLTLAHGLGVVPSFVRYYLICKTTQFNWAVNDTIEVYPHMITNANVEDIGFEATLNSTNIIIYYAASSFIFQILDKTTRTSNGKQITPANWRLVIKASSFN